MKFKILLFISFVCISIFGQIQTVTIGTQVWMTKNLDVSTFRNGDGIPQAKTDEEWEAAGDNKQPAWCYYENNAANGTKYGKLYNWYAVNDARGLAPAGYHIPTDEEWTVLSTFLGGEDVAGKKMKSTSGWNSYTTGGSKTCPNCANWNAEYRKKVPCHTCKDKRSVAAPKVSHVGNGTNSSGFLGLPGGYRNDYKMPLQEHDGNFYNVGKYGNWWSASEDDESLAWSLSLDYSDLFRYDYSKGFGFSVRCVNGNEAVAKIASQKFEGAVFNPAKESGGKASAGSEDGGLGKGNGEARLRINNVQLPQYDSDYDVTIHLQLTVNANGEVVAAKSIKSKTTCTDQLIINQVINEVMKQVKYKKEIGAGLVNILYTVKIIAN